MSAVKKVYHCEEGCCICRKTKDKSVFVPSYHKDYQLYLLPLFKVQRQGFICNPCVMHVNRFRKLTVEERLEQKQCRCKVVCLAYLYVTVYYLE